MIRSLLCLLVGALAGALAVALAAPLLPDDAAVRAARLLWAAARDAAQWRAPVDLYADL